MDICIIHGYKLDGTGSNIYVRNIARNLVKKGHDITIMCQESNAEEIEFVDEVYFFERNNEEFSLKFKKERKNPGSCRVFIPDLAGTLLVYVYDKYDDFEEVVTFQEASRDIIEGYIEKNVKALETIIGSFRPQVIHANHTIMQPYIASQVSAKMKIPYVVTVHGSALNFSVRNSSTLYGFALEGLMSARDITCVSRHNSKELLEFFSSKGDPLDRGTRVIPVGIDIDKFGIYSFSDSKDKEDKTKRLISLLRKKVGSSNRGLSPKDKKELTEKIDAVSMDVFDKDRLREYFELHYYDYDAYCPDRDVARLLEDISFIDSRTVLFVGKYIWTKGVQALIGALPYIFKRYPDTQVLFVGFGQSRAILEALLYCLSTGYRDLFSFLVKNHIDLDPGSKVETPEVTAMFLNSLESKAMIEEYFMSAKELDFYHKVHFTGIMSHDELRYLLPLCDVFVAPSIFTEAFGTVAVEALACGVLPVITYDYGFKEVHENIYKSLGEDFPEKLSLMKLDEYFVQNIARNVNTILGFSRRKDNDFRKRCHLIASDSYSWQKVATEYENVYKRN